MPLSTNNVVCLGLLLSLWNLGFWYIYARQRMPMWFVLRKIDSCLWACHICDVSFLTCHNSLMGKCVLCVTPQEEYSWSLCLVSSELHPVCLFLLPILLCICSLYYVLSLRTAVCWVLWVLVASHWTLSGLKEHFVVTSLSSRNRI